MFGQKGLGLKVNKPCTLCGVRPPTKLSVPAEAAFYRRFHISIKQSLAYKQMLKGLNIEVFQPFSSVVKHQKSLKLNDYSVTMKEMYKNKKIDKEIGAPEKVTVPFLCLTNIPEGILQVLLQSDRDGTYCRNAWQQPDCWEVLFAGDMGAQATKFGFFNTTVQKFNMG